MELQATRDGGAASGGTHGNEDEALACRLAGGAKIKVIGLGGVGSIVAHLLALFLHSLGEPFRLVFVDGDAFEPRNIQRVAFKELGNKAEVKAAETAAMLGPTQVTVVAIPEFLGEKNIDRLIRSGDHVFLCVDNHATRKLVSDHAEKLAAIAIFSGGNDGVDPPRERGTYGSVQVAIRSGGKERTVPLTRFHPEIRSPRGKPPSAENCLAQALSSPQILFANLAVASALLNAFFAYACGRLSYQEVKLDILEARMLPQFPLTRGDWPVPLPPPA
jgi:hypothetical protein